MRKLFIVAMVLLLFVCLGTTPAFATTQTLPTDFNDFTDMMHDMMESPVDYEGLFDLYDLVDGAYTEGYFYWMNQLFDKEPEAFVTALSKQPDNRIENFAFYMALEHSQNLDDYQSCLDTVQQSVPQGSPEEETLNILRSGILKVAPNEDNPKTSDSPAIFCIITVVATLSLIVAFKKRRLFM